MAALVSLVGVSKEFRRPSVVRAVDDVDLDINAGEITGVIGYSGAGKSTLVRLINALERPSSGRVLLDGVDLGRLTERELGRVRSEVGMIFQQFNLFASRTVAGNVAYPLKLAGLGRAERAARVAEMLDFVGLADRASAYPNQLSGGQKQRVGIARALATGPKLLLADEATSALDPETTADVLALLRRVNRDLGTTVVVVTHEMEVVRSICDRVVVMEQGRIVERGPVFDVFARPQSTATRRFVQTVLHDRPDADVISRLRGDHAGTIITVELVDQRTAIFDRLRDQRVHSAVIYGGISEIGDRPFGSLTFELTGEPDAIRSTIASLAEITEVTEWPEGGV
ncbi:methionine ABC transporter ATP-binding protein [Microlunatus soli]|uniref:D-methionine transport system ATP-binding protein n=1 Tax=Microlunatus soli TaxID=630515 RepID=A0A1H1Q3G0_9ACTN|nr:methionine ABC transporter ATP-binding protein [Microlunatus soli]SDS17787.1 D-methionine transport system ATP-binding protein [Microlunatus soli]